jgi:hypothetical protein
MKKAVKLIIAIVIVLIIVVLIFLINKERQKCNVPSTSRQDASSKVINWPVWDSTKSTAENIQLQKAACLAAGYCFNADTSGSAPWCYYPNKIEFKL